MARVDAVVKVGGGVLTSPGHLDAALAVIGDAARSQSLLIVPGGGPFAEAVREVDRRIKLSDEAAHWMAVLSMDQYAHLIASRIARGVIVAAPAEIDAAPGRVPVLAPYRWLREIDPLPHSWSVTSDSIAAWVSGQVGAAALVLVKPPGAAGENVVDPYFARALPPQVRSTIVAADRIDLLRAALERSGSSRSS
jgi:5-(aminomethyl)-3-furanmethanol phosphate kinase